MAAVSQLRCVLANTFPLPPVTTAPPRRSRFTLPKKLNYKYSFFSPSKPHAQNWPAILQYLQALPQGAVALTSIDLPVRKHWPTPLQLFQCVHLLLSLRRTALSCFPSRQIMLILPQHQFQRLPWYVTGSYSELPYESVAYPGGFRVFKTPPRNSEGPPKNRTKLNPIVKIV